MTRMSKRRITIQVLGRTVVAEVDFHPATTAMDRVTQLLDLARDEYGVRSLTYTIDDPEEDSDGQGTT